MECDIVVSVKGLQPGETWPLPPDQLDELAEFLINSMIRQRQENQTHDESLSFPPSPATQKPERISHPGNGVSARNVHRLHAADVDQNLNEVRG